MNNVQRLAAAAAVKRLYELQKKHTQLGSIPWRRLKAEATNLYEKLYIESQSAPDLDILFRAALKGILDAIPRSGLIPIDAAKALLGQARKVPGAVADEEA